MVGGVLGAHIICDVAEDFNSVLSLVQESVFSIFLTFGAPGAERGCAGDAAPALLKGVWWWVPLVI